MDTNQSRGKAACPKIATSRMKICLADLKILSEMIQSFPEQVNEKIEVQTSLEDAIENLNQFNKFFCSVNSYFQNLTTNFRQQMQIILGDNNHIFNYENSLNAILPIVDKKCSEKTDSSISPTDEKTIPCLENCISETLTKKTDDKSIKDQFFCNTGDQVVLSGSNLKCLGNNIVKNDGDLKNKNFNLFVTSTPNDEFSDHLGLENPYDSSNDLPEAEESRNRTLKQTPDSSNMHDGNCSNSAAEVDISNKSLHQYIFCPHINKNITDAESLLVSSSRIEDNGENLNSCEDVSNNSGKVLTEANFSTGINSQISESSLNDQLLEKELVTNSNCPSMQPEHVSINCLSEQKDRSCVTSLRTEENLSTDETLTLNLGINLSKESLDPNRINKKDAIVSTSQKVNDWLNKSLQNEVSSPVDAKSSNGNENRHKELDEDSKTEVDFHSPAEPNENEAIEGNRNLQFESNENIRNKSIPSSVSSNDKNVDAFNPNRNDKSMGEVISLSDDGDNDNYDDNANTKHFIHISRKQESPGENGESLAKFISKCKNNPNLTITPVDKRSKRELVDNNIEIVELGESSNDDECCVIESHLKSPFDIPADSCEVAKKRSIASDTDCNEDVEKHFTAEDNQDLIEDSCSSCDYNNCNFNSLDDDEAKRKLLASSSSPSTFCCSSSDNSDSDETKIIIQKKLKKKKLKVRTEQNLGSLNDKGNDNCGSSKINDDSESDDEVRKMSNWKLLKRRKIQKDSNSDVSEDDSTPKISKIKRKKSKNASVASFDESSLTFSAVSTSSELSGNQDKGRESSISDKQVCDFYRDLLLASNSSSDSECCSEKAASLPVSKPEKRCISDTGSNLNHKKRKFDPLLNCRLSDTESQKPNKDQRKDSSQTLDLKYKKKVEKVKRFEEQTGVESEDYCRSEGNEPGQNLSSPPSFGKSLSDENLAVNSNSDNSDHSTISNDDANVDQIMNEDDDLDNESIKSNEHVLSDSSVSDEDDIQFIPLSQASNNSGKCRRKNIRKVLTAELLTLESKIAAKEEEERRKRLSEREKMFSETFSSVNEGNKSEKLILDIDENTKQELVCVHEDLVKVLKSHQIEGVKFMWNTCFESIERSQNTKGSGCVLAHCMGLGKSLQVVSLVHTLINNRELNINTILIVCPKSVVLNWKNEFKIWLKKIESSDAFNKKVNIFDLSNFPQSFMKERCLKDWHAEGGVMIISYSQLRTLASRPRKCQVTVENNTLTEKFREHLLNPGPDVIICDEGHVLKNNRTGIASVANEIQTKRRIVLTGTPMQNNLVEYYHMVNFVKPNYLGDKKEFMNRFNNPIENGQFEDSTPQDVKIMKRRAHVLHKKLNGIVQRYDSNLLESHLPQKFEYVLKIRLTELQIKAYTAYISDRRGRNTGTISMFKDSFLLSSQLCNHPITLLSSTNNQEELSEEVNEWKKCLNGVNLDDIHLSVKTSLFFEILNRCSEVGDKLLLFSQSLNTLSMIEHFLHKLSSSDKSWIRGKDYFRLDGKTQLKDREEFCQTFNNPLNSRARLFLLSSKAGGLGINLTGANRAVIFDVSWNPSVDTQSVFRIYRFGQLKTCYVYRFVSKGAMEEKVYDRQITKLSTSCRVIDAQQINRHYPQSYLQALYQYDFNYNNAVRPTPRVPADKILAELVKKSDWIDSYDDHNALLANILDEELNEEERQKAWEEYENEKNNVSASSYPLGSTGVTSNVTPSNAAFHEPNLSQLENKFAKSFPGSKSFFNTYKENKGAQASPTEKMDDFDIVDKKLEAARNLNEMLFLKQIIPLPYKDSSKISDSNETEPVKQKSSPVNFNQLSTSEADLNIISESVTHSQASVEPNSENLSKTSHQSLKDCNDKNNLQIDKKDLSQSISKNINEPENNSANHEFNLLEESHPSTESSKSTLSSSMSSETTNDLKSIFQELKYFTKSQRK